MVANFKTFHLTSNYVNHYYDLSVDSVFRIGVYFVEMCLLRFWPLFFQYFYINYGRIESLTLIVLSHRSIIKITWKYLSILRQLAIEK